MKTVYLVRHGQSEANLRSEIYQTGESPLTELGRRQAEQIAERAKLLQFDVMIASTMRRTQETATAISNSTGRPFESHALFEERHEPSSLAGKRRSDPEVQSKLQAWFKSSSGFGPKVEDGETFAETSERAGKALRFLEERAEESILVVGHGFFTRMLIARAWHGEKTAPELFEPMEWGMRTINTGLSVMKYDPTDEHRSWWLLVWNDHTHLG